AAGGSAGTSYPDPLRRRSSGRPACGPESGVLPVRGHPCLPFLPPTLGPDVSVTSSSRGRNPGRVAPLTTYRERLKSSGILVSSAIARKLLPSREFISGSAAAVVAASTAIRNCVPGVPRVRNYADSESTNK